ncbi:hypothetical protein [Streptomyces sp. NPDC101455]|uniref:hypothetical protein n=1 Tax=Streptomyces sp. NPDC101455 TaxID=3366142 RepID=UPI00382AEE32
MPQSTDLCPGIPSGLRNEQPNNAFHELAEPVLNKVIEVAVLLLSEAKEAPLSQGHLSSAVREQTTGIQAEFLADVLEALPDIKTGETGGAYGTRVLEAVRQSTGRISTKVPNRIATSPATIRACEQDMAGPDDKGPGRRMAKAAVQRGLVRSVGTARRPE